MGCMEKHFGVAELRDHLGKRVDAAHFHSEPTVIEKNGEPRAVLVPYLWWLQADKKNASEH